ncbi:hypothetical protein JXB27_04610 [Candidatus Woesearchaeota archaeon]|nr:hypothetical protein [Candidatus Woesearchaeota archaeon]
MQNNLDNLVLLSDVEFAERPIFSIHRHGSFSINFPFLFYSHIFKSEEGAKKLAEETAQIPFLKEKGVRVRYFKSKVKDWHLVHVLGPCDIVSKLPKAFSTPDYSLQLRNYFAPGTFVKPNESLLPNLKRKRDFNSASENLTNSIAAKLNDRTKEYQEELAKEVFLAAKSLNDDELGKKFPQFVPDVLSMNRAFNGILNCSTFPNENSRTIEIIYDDVPFERIRPMKSSDWKRFAWAFIDKEVDFKESNPATSFSGTLLIDNKEEERTIRTIREHSQPVINGFKIENHASEKELHEADARYLREKNPLFIAGHNVPYDLSKSNELDLDSRIGENGRRARAVSSRTTTRNVWKNGLKTKITESNPRRAKVNGKFIIDTCPLSAILFPYLPNFKLETVMNHVRHLEEGEQFRKDLDYHELAILQKKAKAEGKEAADLISEYLSHDVDSLPELIKSQHIWTGMKLISGIANDFNQNPADLMYDVKSINLRQDLSYLENVGLDKKETGRMDEKHKLERKHQRKRYREILEKMIYQTMKEGNLLYDFSQFGRKHILHNVTQAIISDAYAMKNIIANKNTFPLAQKLFNRTPEDGRREYSEFEKSILIQYQNALVDYGLSNMYADIIIKEEMGDEGVEKARRRLGGNYAVNETKVSSALTNLAFNVKRFAEMNGYKMLQMKDRFIYFIGGEDDFYPSSYLAKTVVLPEAVVSFREGIPRIKYSFYGHAKNKRNNKPDQLQLKI